MNIPTRVSQIRQLIQQNEMAYGRSPGSTRIIAVTKGHSIQDIEEAISAGLLDFGESYWQEAKFKIEACQHHSLCWHFLGPLQSNKIKYIARYFDWVHSVASYKMAKLLNDSRPLSMPPLNICIQLNLDLEKTKTGILLEEASSLIPTLLPLTRLRLRGLMMIPKPTQDAETQYLSFRRLADVKKQLNQQLTLNLDTLSMGMSQDFPAAVRAGSTMVRLGTAIFGARE